MLGTFEALLVTACLPCLASVRTTDRLSATNESFLHTTSIKVLHQLAYAFSDLVSHSHAVVEVGSLKLTLDKTDRVRVLTILSEGCSG
eukprot:2899234-Amphidinium_carterae.1